MQHNLSHEYGSIVMQNVTSFCLVYIKSILFTISVMATYSVPIYKQMKEAFLFFYFYVMYGSVLFIFDMTLVQDDFF